MTPDNDDDDDDDLHLPLINGPPGQHAQQAVYVQ